MRSSRRATARAAFAPRGAGVEARERRDLTGSLCQAWARLGCRAVPPNPTDASRGAAVLHSITYCRTPATSSICTPLGNDDGDGGAADQGLHTCQTDGGQVRRPLLPPLLLQRALTTQPRVPRRALPPPSLAQACVDDGRAHGFPGTAGNGRLKGGAGGAGGRGDVDVLRVGACAGDVGRDARGPLQQLRGGSGPAVIIPARPTATKACAPLTPRPCRPRRPRRRRAPA